ncbi:cytochrome P450 306a1 [Dendroctonus ponderosae]|uniref:cytochrome P450 306a1 n=1 Tax=Dendroctonus ponderosae TaxID=77166 RepID=UPI0020354686|nr:cytochrome P450 306a1 [Dendroctonus ponderosae]
MIFYVLLLLLALLALLGRPRGLPPGPWGLPLLGYLPWIDPKAPHLTLARLARKFGPIYSLTLGRVCAIVLTDPRTIRRLLAKDATSGRAPLYVTHGIMHGYGLICAEGALWRDQRKFVHNWLRSAGGTKLGGRRKLMELLILQHAQELVQHIDAALKRHAVDPMEALRHHLGSLVNQLVFGRRYQRDDPTWVWLQELQEEGCKLIGVAGPLNFLPLLRFLPTYKRTMSFLVEGQRKSHQYYQKLAKEVEPLVPLDRNQSLDALPSLLEEFLREKRLKSGTEDGQRFYSDRQMDHLLADIFGASLDTTLTTLRWFLLFLGVNQDVQRELRLEIEAVVGKRAPSLEDLAAMPFLEACIAETQRIRSVVPLGVPHGALEDLEVDGYRIPKGSLILLLQWAIHMDEAQHRDPERFNPRRFLDAEGRFCKGEFFMPFQTGKRMCVGDELAKEIMFLFTASLFQSFRVQVVGEPELEGVCGITLSPQPYQVVFQSLA